MLESSLSRITLGVALCMAACLACATDETFAPLPDFNTMYQRLRVDQHAVQLSMSAPYDTLQLVATPRTLLGAALDVPAGVGNGTAVWSSSDSTKVLVTQKGVLRARGVTSGAVRIIVRRQINNVTYADTAQVQVVATTTTTRPLGTIGIRPLSPDSPKVASRFTRTLSLRVLDEGNATMAGAMAYFTSADTSIAQFSNPWNPSVIGGRPGKTLITATTWIYGVVKTDTFTITVGQPVTMSVVLGRRFFTDGPVQFFLDRQVIEVGPGATVDWSNSSGGGGQAGKIIDIVFDDPAFALAATNPPDNSGSGNMISVLSDTTLSTTVRRRYRRFVTPGSYPYRVQPLGLVGTIHVRAE